MTGRVWLPGTGEVYPTDAERDRYLRARVNCLTELLPEDYPFIAVTVIVLGLLFVPSVRRFFAR